MTQKMLNSEREIWMNRHVYYPLIALGTIASIVLAGDIVRTKWNMRQSNKNAALEEKAFEAKYPVIPFTTNDLAGFARYGIVPTNGVITREQVNLLKERIAEENFRLRNPDLYPTYSQPAEPITPKTNAPAKPKSDSPIQPQKTLIIPQAQPRTNVYETLDLKKGITDEFFRNYQALTEDQIRDLLFMKNSCLKNLGIESLIVKECAEHRINPLLVISRLQSEQGLVEQKKPATKYQLDYAMGVGDLENGKKKPSKGLAYQLQVGIAALDSLHREFKPGKKLKINFGRKTVVPQNAAQYAMSRYTPHDHGTQLNFKVTKRYAGETNKLQNQQIRYNVAMNRRY